MGMPALACRTCGRRVDSPVALESLLPEERRCPRCGARLEPERRFHERRQGERRRNAPGDPSPPSATGERRRTSSAETGPSPEGR